MMKFKLLLLVSTLLFSVSSFSQDKYFTKSAKIHFYSSTSLEDFEAKNKSAVCVLNTKTGSLQFSTLIKGFEFENEEMQEHFNDHYLESDKYPKSEFKGQILNNAAVNYKKAGSYPVQVKGQLTLHGITKEVLTSGLIKVDNKGVNSTATFTIKLADYGIKIPALAKDKIAKVVKITVNASLDPLK